MSSEKRPAGGSKMEKRFERITSIETGRDIDNLAFTRVGSLYKSCNPNK
jgi:hypothetical protein